MTETIDQAIQKMAEMTKASSQADQALKFSQAALNLAHLKGVLHSIELDKKKAASS
jgi:hypothetical protein